MVSVNALSPMVAEVWLSEFTVGITATDGEVIPMEASRWGWRRDADVPATWRGRP